MPEPSPSSRFLVAALVPALASFCLAATGAANAASQDASAWVASADSKARLVSGMAEVDGKPTLMAGVQLRMAPGWKTYWRNPGDSGVPPSFDFKGSKNLKQAELLYPAPHRIAEANGTAIGYEDEVIFPIKVTPQQDGEPITLKLAFEYGLCKELCVPNEVDLELLVSPGEGKSDAFLLESALALVPKAARPGLLPAVENVTANLDAPKPTIAIDAAFPKGARATDLFIESGDAYVPLPKPETPPVEGRQRFLVSFGSAAEAAPLKGKTLTLTLVSDVGSTETKWTAN